MNFTSDMFGTRDAMVNLLHNAYNLQSMLRTLDINKYFEKQFKYQIQSGFFANYRYWSLQKYLCIVFILRLIL